MLDRAPGNQCLVFGQFGFKKRLHTVETKALRPAKLQVFFRDVQAANLPVHAKPTLKAPRELWGSAG